MSVVSTKVQIGQNPTALNNFVWERDASGLLVLRRGTHDVVGNTLLKVNLDGGVHLNQPAFKARLSANQSLPTSTGWTRTNMNTVVWEYGTGFDGTNYRYKPTVAGLYRISGSLGISGAGTTRAVAGIFKNGSLYDQGQDTLLPSASSALGSVVTSLVQMDGVNDYVDLRIYSTASAGVLSVADYSNVFFGELVRAA